MLPRLAVAVLSAAAVLTACSSGSAPGSTVTTTITRAPSTPAVAPSTSATPPPPTAAEVRATAQAAIAAISAKQPSGAISYAALNTKTGASFSGGQTSGMWTASAYKLFVLETLMLNGTLSGGEQASATRAIENSDNVAGYQLFLDAGGRPALTAAARRFGMTHTVPGNSDPTFTTTSGSDCLTLLKNLVAPGQFSAEQRNYVLGLMREVESDQRWGVGVAADRGSSFANKNGWLSIDDSNGPGETDNGLWAVTSLGVLSIGGDQVLMAVLTKHQPDMAAGVALVQQLARTIAPTVSG